MTKIKALNETGLKAFQKLIEDRKAQLAAVEDMLKEESSVSINFIKEEHIPSDITPEKILPLLSIFN